MASGYRLPPPQGAVSAGAAVRDASADAAYLTIIVLTVIVLSLMSVAGSACVADVDSDTIRPNIRLIVPIVVSLLFMNSNSGEGRIVSQAPL
jgi:hypothetical protein